MLIADNIEISDIVELKKIDFSKIVDVNTLLKSNWYLLGMERDGYIVGRADTRANI